MDSFLDSSVLVPIIHAVLPWLGFGGRCLIIALCLLAAQAWGQETVPESPKGEPSPVSGPPILPPSPGPSIAVYPLELLGLLAPPAQRGPLTLTPAIAISEEYNDNIFQNNAVRQWDFITSFTPSVSLSVNRPTLQLNGGYSFSADVYARETQFTSGFARQNFIASGLYRLTPTLTLTAVESFAFDRNGNLVPSQLFSTGRQESWTNTFTPALTWQMTATDWVTLGGTYSVLRFEGTGSGVDSDTYAFLGNLTHAFTARLTGLLGYGFTYLDFEGQGISRTHTPTLGFSYQLTQTLTGTVTGGPAVTLVAGETLVSPAANVSLVQTLPFGSVGVQYTRGVSTGGGFGGTSDTQTVSGTLVISGLQRGLLIALNPLYSISESVSSRQSDQVDVGAFTLNLAASYQVASFATVFLGYSFFHQRTRGSSSVQTDVDQNRVRFGLQLGYPIVFD